MRRAPSELAGMREGAGASARGQLSSRALAGWMGIMTLDVITVLRYDVPE